MSSYYKEHVQEIYKEMEDALRSRIVKTAFPSGAVSAVVFVTFLGYLSDKKESMQIPASDLVRMDALAKLYPDIVDMVDLEEYMDSVEKYFGFSDHLLDTFVHEIKESEVSSIFKNLLQIASELDFSEENHCRENIRELMNCVERLLKSEGIRVADSYTPHTIGEFLAGIADIHDGMSVYDPCVGYGLTMVEISRAYSTNIYIEEEQSDVAAVAEMLLIMNGMRSGKVECNEISFRFLDREIQNKYDRIVCRPAFNRSMNIKNEDIDKNLLSEQILYYPEIPLEDSWIYIRHILASLKEEGKAVVLLSNRELSRKGRSSITRERIVGDGYISSVIQLPADLMPSTGVKYSVVVLQKENSVSNYIYMADLSTGLWDEKIGKAEDTDEGTKELAHFVMQKECIEGTSRYVSRAEVEECDFQLVAARYITKNPDVKKYLQDSKKLYREMDQLDQEYRILQDQEKMAMKFYCAYKNNNRKYSNTLFKGDVEMQDSITMNEGMEKVMKGFGLTGKQTEILYNLEYQKISNDFEIKDGLKNNNTIKTLKENWQQEWLDLVMDRYSAIMPDQGVQLRVYNYDELIDEIKKNNLKEPWFRLVLLELMLFEPYYPLTPEEEDRGIFLELQNPVYGYNKDEGDKFLDKICTDFFQEGYSKRFKDAWDKCVKYLSKSLEIGERAISDKAIKKIINIAVAEKTLDHTSMVYTGIMPSGIQGCVESGESGVAIVELIGGGTALKEFLFNEYSGAKKAARLYEERNLIYQVSKLLVSVEEIFLKDEQDLDYVKSLCDICKQSSKKIAEELGRDENREDAEKSSDRNEYLKNVLKIIDCTKKKILEYEHNFENEGV